MRTISATQLARNLSRVLDRLGKDNDEIIVERNGRPVARLLPGPGQMNATEAMSDLYRTLSPKEARDWEKDIKGFRVHRLSKEQRDPWRS